MEKTTLKLKWETPEIVNLDIYETESGVTKATVENTTFALGS